MCDRGIGILSIRPQLDDMRRLWEVSKRPWLAKHIKHVEIYVGDFRYGALMESLERESKWRENGYEGHGESAETSVHLRELKRIFDFSEHVVNGSNNMFDRARFDDAAPPHCIAYLMAHALSSLPCLESLGAISSRNPLLSHPEYIHDAWRSMCFNETSPKNWRLSQSILRDIFYAISHITTNSFRRFHWTILYSTSSQSRILLSSN
jgi:hypothetical protein